MNVCEVCGRNSNEFTIKKYKGMFLCGKHISQYWRYGKFLDKTIYDSNDFIINDDYAEIILRDKKCNIVGKTIIDIDDVDLCKKYKWHIKHSLHTDYAITTIDENTKIFLHRLILDYYGEMDVDHNDHNGLNNRKYNLEVCSHSKNLTNQHNINNGIYQVQSGRFRSTICINNKTIYIGTFDTFKEALTARKNKEYELFG